MEKVRLSENLKWKRELVQGLPGGRVLQSEEIMTMKTLRTGKRPEYLNNKVRNREVRQRRSSRMGAEYIGFKRLL